jgi:hypothetical protein
MLAQSLSRGSVKGCIHKKRSDIVHYTRTKSHHIFPSSKHIIQLVSSKRQLLLGRNKVLPLFGCVWLFRDQFHTGVMSIRRIELEPTDESLLQLIRGSNNQFLINCFDSVVYKSLECD